MKSFASDNWSGVDARILQAITDANESLAPPYGNDPYTEKAIQVFKKTFGESANAFFVSNGTAANVLSLRAIVQSHHAVICSDCAHFMNKEAGAAANYVGCALIPVRSKHGKISADAIEETILRLQGAGYNSNKPRAVSVTQSTEYGTVYTIDELMSISKVCKKYGLLFHMDGVRLSNAAAALDVPLKAITSDVGVDVITFGGTKNGLMFGDAIVIFNKQFADDFYYIQKQGFQLNSKMRFLTAQFIAYLEKNIWLDNARHANAMSRKLAAGLEKIPGVEFPFPVQTNQLFPCFSTAIIEATQKEFAYSIWDKKTGMVRLLTSFITSTDDVEKFIELAKR